MDDFVNTYPALPRRFDADSVQRFRQHEGSIDDEHDAARDREAEDGRQDEGAGAVVWGAIALIVGMACVSAFGDALMALAREVVR